MSSKRIITNINDSRLEYSSEHKCEEANKSSNYTERVDSFKQKETSKWISQDGEEGVHLSIEK